jgi:hypothetical protein
MKVPHLKRDGSFRPQIRKELEKLKTSDVVRIPFHAAGGYKGDVRVRIRSRKEDEFEVSLDLSDWTRFPARIRAAATEMRDQGFKGAFQIRHDDGVLEIKTSYQSPEPTGWLRPAAAHL